MCLSCVYYSMGAYPPLFIRTRRMLILWRSTFRVACFSHYDVISASHRHWKTQPFTLTGLNGYLYGRGVTDNKGPILATACAASDLLRKRLLTCDIVFLIEGEEEAGSAGFADAVQSHKVRVRRNEIFNDTDVLLL